MAGEMTSAEIAVERNQRTCKIKAYAVRGTSPTCPNAGLQQSSARGKWGYIALMIHTKVFEMSATNKIKQSKEK